MNPWYISAAGLSVLIALAHSVVGEQRIFRHLRMRSANDTLSPMKAPC